MDIITFPRLKISELQTLTESTLTICEPLAEVAEQRQAVETEFTNFKESVLKKYASADDKQTIDKERDRYNSGFFFAIRAEKFYPYEDESAKETVDKLLNLSSKYGAKINRLPLNEETAALDNCMQETEAIDLTPLSSPAVAQWIPLIKDANQRFKNVANEYVEKNAAISNLESASVVAPGLMHALELLAIQIFSVVNVSPTDALTKAYSEIETLADTYR